MAEFSKQYAEKHMGFKGDFDIEEEFNKLKVNSYINIICEGYGFVAIGKNENKEMVFAMPTKSIKDVIWVSKHEMKNYYK